MIALELHEIEVDYCVTCGGLWFDAGEIEMLFDGAFSLDEIIKSLEADKTTRLRKKKCPICLKKMHEITFNNITIDKCSHNDGIWLDKGELEQLIKIGQLDKTGKITALLKEMFYQEI
ncbi:rhomboid family protein [Candidatus Magnetoovum chiemensis]|nr:rhomboid family protein [Candidatus Magnetoovum chiemensis]